MSTPITAEPMIEARDEHVDVTELGKHAQIAAARLARAPDQVKNAALRAAASSLRTDIIKILDANKRDLESAPDLSSALQDRLILSEDRIDAIATGLEQIALLTDPVGAILDERTRPNGLVISRVRVPLGVVGIIYESRPNVTADAGALCLKSANATILRGGSESFHSSRAIHACLQHGLEVAGLPKTSIQLIPTRNRSAVGEMLRLTDYIDVIVPRGGPSLIKRVYEESRIPVLAHLVGNCHTYVDGAADLKMARAIVLNAKMRRPGICGATETLLVDRAIANESLPHLVDDLFKAGCEVRGDEDVQNIIPRVQPAAPEDWGREYLDAIIAVKVVDGVDGAINHIAQFGSDHTESIITNDQAKAEHFLNSVNSAIVLHNASTQFADGGEFGMGAEIGISTGKLHARGPVGVEQLTTFKYVVRGTGQVRP